MKSRRRVLRIKLEVIVVCDGCAEKMGGGAFERDMLWRFRLVICMAKSLPAVGTFALLDALTGFVPDDFINLRWPVPRRRGPRFHFSAAQLWRVHLLAALTGGQSFNAVRRSLSEQRPLRRFAHLANERSIPDIHQGTKRDLRVQWKVAMITKLKADMKAHCDYAEDQPLRCRQGQELEWLGYDEREYQHWFAPPPHAPLCDFCWERSTCSRQFSISADTHETFFGMIPLNTALAQRLIHSVRSWIEPSQSFEKNQLGLKTMFLNSLRLCWTTSLLADSAALLRILAILEDPPAKSLLQELFPTQSQLPLE